MMKNQAAPLKDCMQAFLDLSEDCRVAIIRVAAVGKAQGRRQEALRRRKAGQGAMASCMRSHAADLSDGCKRRWQSA